jgi:glycosyltransferase involved in cell wall biosynthesis
MKFGLECLLAVLDNVMTKICLVPKLKGVGGMVSFQSKLAQGLSARGINVCYDLNETPFDAVLVIGGTRKIPGLYQVKRSGIPIIQRLNGMNWIHRLKWTGLRHFLRAEYGNLLLVSIRKWFVNRIVYQSKFAKGWWERVWGDTKIPNWVVYNGVDLDFYTPDGPHQRQDDRQCLLVVEGNLGGGYEMGLETAIKLSERIKSAHSQDIDLVVVGGVKESLKERTRQQSNVEIHFTGQVPRENIPEIDRSANLLFAADLNAACPNAVIEALACGLPVIAYDTGALPELVTSGSGKIVPYGGDPWKLESPDLDILASAAVEVMDHQSSYRAGARKRAEHIFSLDKMLDGYLDALFS